MLLFGLQNYLRADNPLSFPEKKCFLECLIDSYIIMFLLLITSDEVWINRIWMNYFYFSLKNYLQ